MRPRPHWKLLHSLKLTAKAPKMVVSNRHLQTSRGLFSGDMLVSGRVIDQ